MYNRTIVKNDNLSNCKFIKEFLISYLIWNGIFPYQIKSKYPNFIFNFDSHHINFYINPNIITLKLYNNKEIITLKSQSFS